MKHRDFSQNAVKVFFSYYRPHWKLFALDILMALVGVAAELVFPWATRQALHTLLPEQRYAAFFTVMAILLGAYVLRSASVYVVTVFGHDLGVRVEADMRADIFRHVQDLSFSFFDRHRTGKLMSRIRAAYATGRGKITIRARAEFEEHGANRTRIIVTELPYQVNKKQLIKNIADQVKDKRLEDISDLRDESDRNGMRIVIELKRDANPQVVLHDLSLRPQLRPAAAPRGKRDV